RHEDDRGGPQVGVGADLAQHREAVHVRHEDVQGHRVKALAAQGEKGLLAAGGDGGVDVERRQPLGDELGDLGLVVDDQHAAALDDVQRVPVVGGDRSRDEDVEGGTAPGLGVDLDDAVVQVD